MTRYADDHKTRTRERIVAAAGRQLRRQGIDGAGIAGIMKGSGLTNGAFYAHFASKDALVAEVLTGTLEQQATAIEDLAPGREPAVAFVQAYLSAEHVQDRENGCPSAALLDEVGRCSPGVRDAYSEGAQRILAAVKAQLATVATEGARTRALTLFPLLVGTLQLARALDDPRAVEEVLAAGLQSAITLIDAGSPPAHHSQETPQ